MMFQRSLHPNSPYPYHVRLNGIGVMLRPQQGPTGPIYVAKKVKGWDNTAPVDFRYSAQFPFEEGTQRFRRPYYGMGQRFEPSKETQMYFYGIGIDTSCGGLIILGPQCGSTAGGISYITPNGSSGPVRAFSEMYVGGERTLMLVSGKKVLQKTAANDLAADWTTSLDLGNTNNTANTQTISLTGGPTGGTFTIAYPGDVAGAQTVSDAPTAKASAIKTAVDAAGANSGPVASIVSGPPGGPWQVTLVGPTPPAATLTVVSSLTGGSSPNVVVTNGQNPLNAVQYQSIEPMPYLLLAVDVGCYWYMNTLGVWAQAVLPGIAFAVPGNNFAEGGNQIANSFIRAGGTVAGSTHYQNSLFFDANSAALEGTSGSPPWGEAGTGDYLITPSADRTQIRAMLVANGTLALVKDRGLFLLDLQRIQFNGTEVSTAHLVDANLGTVPNAMNGVGATTWSGDMYIPLFDQWCMVSLGGTADEASAVVEPVGPGRMIENMSPVRGQVMCSAGHADWFNYFCIYNGTDSHLCKLGSWVNPEEASQSQSQDWVFTKNTHGSLAKFAGKQATAMLISDVGGNGSGALGTGGNARLYIGFSDGTITWLTLPRYSPFPPEDSACLFQKGGVTAGEPVCFVAFPRHDWGFASNPKVYRGATVAGGLLDSTNKAYVFYTVDSSGNGPPAYAGEIANAYTTSAMRQTFPTAANNTSPTGHALDVALGLQGASNGTSTPIIEGLYIHEALYPTAVYEYLMTVICEDNYPRRDGQPDWKSGRQIRTAIRSCIARMSQGEVPLELPDGSTVMVSVIDGSEMGDSGADATQSRFEADVNLTAVQTVLMS